MAVTPLTYDVDADADVADIAALTPSDGDMLYWASGGTRYNTTPSTSYIRGLLNTASEAALKAAVNLEIGVDVQAYDADLTTWAGLTPSAFFQTLVDDADAATARATLGLTIGTHVQAYDADLTTWAGVTPGTGVATALAVNVGSAGAVVVNGGALGTPSSGTLTNATGLPVGGISGLGTGVATFLATPSSANLVAAMTDEAGSGALYFTGGALGTPASATLTNATGLPVSGITASTSTALGVGSIELGHASDTTIARSSAGVVTIEGVEVTTNTASQTLTNKTLSSPTLSGTVAGTPTYSSAQTFPGATVGGTLNVNAGGTTTGTITLGTGGNNIITAASGAQLSINTAAYGVVDVVAGELRQAGVAVVTTSGSQTLTNKTLSSPTLSGTVAGGPAFTVTSAGAATTPLILRNASSNASTEVILRFDPSVGGNRYAEISSSNDGSNNTGLTFRGGAGGSLTTGLTIGAAGAVNAPVSLTIGGVAVPTISSTDTLSNKTLSSPTLSGTVAGSPTASGNWTWSGAGPTLRFIETGAPANNKNWVNYANASTLVFAAETDVGGLSNWMAVTRSGGTPTGINLSATVVQINGVAIPTISSTSTLTNKTLSSPTLSGTVLVTGGVINMGAGSNKFYLYDSSAIATLGMGNDLSGSSYELSIFAGSNTDALGRISFGRRRSDNGTYTERGYISTADGSFVWGAPTGGAKGAGTINAVAVYDDNVLLTDLVLDYAVTNTFDAVKYANHPLKDQVAAWMFNPDQYADFWKTERRLPGMITWDDPADKPSTGESITRLTAVVEMQAALIENLNQRLKELEQ